MNQIERAASKLNQTLSYGNLTLTLMTNENDDRYNDVFVEYQRRNSDAYSRRFRPYETFSGSYNRAINEGNLDADRGWEEYELTDGQLKWLECGRVQKWLEEVCYG